MAKPFFSFRNVLLGGWVGLGKVVSGVGNGE
jgi:hypothetical protein